MGYTKFRQFVIISAAVLATTTGAQALCSNNWGDVSITCPKPVPYTGPKKLTDTSRNMATVGTPGLYKNWGNGYDVQVYLHTNGTGHQNFRWQK